MTEERHRAEARRWITTWTTLRPSPARIDCLAALLARVEAEAVERAYEQGRDDAERGVHRVHCPAYDKSIGDERLCECGHPYYRHFDTYDNMRPVGCKYCECFVPTALSPIKEPKC